MDSNHRKVERASVAFVATAFNACSPEDRITPVAVNNGGRVGYTPTQIKSSVQGFLPASARARAVP